MWCNSGHSASKTRVNALAALPPPERGRVGVGVRTRVGVRWRARLAPPPPPHTRRRSAQTRRGWGPHTPPRADAALGRARDLGAEHADDRVARIVPHSVHLRDAGVTGDVDATTEGLAVRVVVDGAWGFASHVDLTPERAAATE